MRWLKMGCMALCMQGVLVHKTTSENNAAPNKRPARYPHSHYFGCLGRAILRWLLAQTLILLQGSSNQAKQARIEFLQGLGISVRSQAWEPTAQARQLGKRVYQAFHRTDPAMAEALVKQSQTARLWMAHPSGTAQCTSRLLVGICRATLPPTLS